MGKYKITEEQLDMVVWVFNRLIDKYPLVYEILKKEYLKEKNK